MTNIDERAEFEKWVSTFKDADLTPANKESIFERSYTYESDQTEAAWDGWQARATLPTAEVSDVDVPSWEELADTVALELINALELPYGEGKDPDIRKALHTQIKVRGLLETFVKIGVQIGEKSARTTPPEPTAEVPEYEVVRIMAIAAHGERSGAEEYAKQLAAYRALSDYGYKVVRKS
jgi:hypothetical protein